MANIIIEYKKDRNSEKGKIKPLWLDDGGICEDIDNYTFVGIVKDPEVKIPETVVRFTKESYVERQLNIHGRYPFKKQVPETTHPVAENWVEMTDEEVTEEAEGWWDNNIN
jgi:hypothetical protein|tara:strand:+ start:2011 stop:2343 length:333 start_codon:yes stop_codon:yes gene_type:complete